MKSDIINKLSWNRAVAMALEVYRREGSRQRVYYDPVQGWTYGAADREVD